MKSTVVAAVVAGLGVVVAGTAGAAVADAAPPGVPPPVFQPSAGLPVQALLAGPQLVAHIVDAPAMSVVTTRTMSDQSATVDPARCVSAWVPADPQSYAGTGYTGAATQVLADGNSADPAHLITQAVVSFPSAHAAGAYVEKAAHDWIDCANRDITFTPTSGQGQQWHFGKPAARRGIITLPQLAATGEASCQRAIGARDNLVFDVLACGYRGADPTDQAAAIIAVTAANMPQSI